MAKTPSAPPSFEKALSELESIVDGMESGKLTLEESLANYQRGVELLKHCQGTLAAADEKIQQLEATSLSCVSAAGGESK